MFSVHWCLVITSEKQSQFTGYKLLKHLCRRNNLLSPEKSRENYSSHSLLIHWPDCQSSHDSSLSWEAGVGLCLSKGEVKASLATGDELQGGCGKKFFSIQPVNRSGHNGLIWLLQVSLSPFFLKGKSYP